MFKASQYNIILDLDEGAFVLRNLFSGKTIYVSPEKSDLVKKFLSSELQADNTEENIFLLLVEYGFLVDSNLIESQQADYVRRKICYENKLQLVVMPTSGCNFRCVYCFEEERQQTMTSDNVNAIISYLDKNMKKFSSTNIQWFGGEPLLCKKEIETIMQAALEFAKRDRKALTSGITTNGYLLDLQTYKMLRKYHTSWIQVSVDGVKETHNRQRPHKTDKNSYDKIIENLRAIRDKTRPSACKIYYRVTITKQILPHINEILRFFKEEFATDPRFKLSLQPEMDWGGDRIENEQSNIPSVRDTVSCLYKANELGLMPIGHHTQLHSGLICEATRLNSYVFYPGNKIYKCPMAIYSKYDSSLYHGEIGVVGNEGQLIVDEKINAEWIESVPFRKDECFRCRYYVLCFGVQTCPLARKFSGNNQRNICKKSIYNSR